MVATTLRNSRSVRSQPTGSVVAEKKKEKNMNRTPVASSQLKSVGHDPATNKMHIEFKNGSIYEYDDVSADEHQSLMGASSVGSHFDAHVKHGFAYKKL